MKPIISLLATFAALMQLTLTSCTSRPNASVPTKSNNSAITYSDWNAISNSNNHDGEIYIDPCKNDTFIVLVKADNGETNAEGSGPRFIRGNSLPKHNQGD